MAEVVGFPTRVPLDISFEDLTKLRGYDLGIQSRSGDGAKSPVGEGTATTSSGLDTNASNLNKN